MLDKDKIKESLTIKDIELILTELGSQPPKYDRHGNPIFQTVCHGGHKHKLYYYDNADNQYDRAKIFHCYSECQESFDIYELILKVNYWKKEDFPKAVKYVAELTGKYFTCDSILQQVENNFIIDDWEFIERYKRTVKKEIILPEFSPTVLEAFNQIHHNSWLREGISEATMNKYEVCFYLRDERIVIPHYDINNRLIGIRGRSLKQEAIDAGFKYMPLKVGDIDYHHPTMFNLYGLNHTQHAIRKIKKALIFEGEKSVMKCDDYYGENNFTVASCGMNVSNWQRDMILSLGVEEVFIAYDKQFEDPNSEKAKRYAEELTKTAYKFSPYVRTYIIWDDMGLLEYKDAPVDKGQKAFELLMKNKYEVKSKEYNYNRKD